MKGEKKLPRPRVARTGATAELGVDPFAADLFAAAKPVTAETLPDELDELELVEVSPVVAWHSRLPFYARGQAQISAELAEIPAELVSFFWEKSCRVIARYTKIEESSIVPSWFELGEITAHAFDEQTGNMPHTFAGLRLEPGNHPFLLAMEATFGVSLTDKVLGGPGEPPDSLRNLSTGERAVVEFITLQILRELEESTAPFALRLEQLGPTAPVWLHEPKPELNLGLAALIRLKLDNVIGLVRLYIPAPTARAMTHTGTTKKGTATKADIASFSKLSPDFALSILIGHTELTTVELISLELGDVVVIEWPQIKWHNNTFQNKITVLVGDGKQARLQGMVTENQDALYLTLTEIQAGDAPTLADRLDMEIPVEDELAPVQDITEETGEGGALLDAIMLTVHVELASRRVRLDELARLRVNQVLELGCKATDPVDLLVDGRRVARGELVDIEGRLGVRITHLA